MTDFDFARRRARRRSRTCFEGLESRAVLDSTVVFNELAYHPRASQGTTEWIELYNQMAVSIDLSGWSIEGLGYQFPANTTLAGREYLVLAKDPVALHQQTGLSNISGPFAGRLDDSGETLVLRNASRRVMDTMTYDDDAPWPLAAAGTGATLAKRAPQMNSDAAERWSASSEPGGTPGRENFPKVDTTPIVTTLIARNAVWRYEATGQAPPTEWNGTGFSDTPWPPGEAPLFAGTFRDIPLPDGPANRSGQPVGLANSSFEANTNGGVGYGGITSWNTTGGTGVNPASDGAAPFADNGVIPDGRRIAFIQGPGSVSQSISGLVVGQSYWLELHYNARGCCGAQPSLSVSFAGQVLIPPTEVEPIGGIGEAYRVAMIPFTAQTASGTLLIRNVATVGDHSLLLDGVSITPRTNDDLPLVNGSFEASGVVAPTPGYLPNRALAGWTYVGTGNLGIAVPSSPMFDNGQLPDGRTVAFLENSGQIRQTIEGLEPGRRYELQFSVNARASGNTPQLRVTIDELTLAEELVPPVGANNPFALRTYRFTAMSNRVTLGIAQTADGAVALLDRLSLRALASPLVTPMPLHASTYYFRHDFDYNGAAEQTTLTLRHYLDDGAVFYLNGHELARHQLSTPQPTHTTLADGVVIDPTWSEPIELPGRWLVPGRNILAVELHRASLADLDAAMALELIATEYPATEATTRTPVVLNEVSAAGSQTRRLELHHRGTRPIELSDLELTIADLPFALPQATLAAGGYLSVEVSRPWQDAELVALYDRVTGTTLDAIYVDNSAQARGSDDAWYYVENETPSALNHIAVEQDIVINEIMYHHAPQYADPGIAPTYQRTTVLPLNGAWRYNESTPGLSTGWQNTVYPLGGEWKQGPGLFGFETGAVIAPGLGTTWSGPGRVTHYLQTEFDVRADQLDDGDRFQFRHAIDDGAIIWLNGHELLRLNLPAGDISATTLAQRSVNNAVLSDYLSIPREMLVEGTNRLSVELHQSAANSSDAIFGIEILFATPIDPGVPSSPFAENPTEWIELTNRSSRTIDLSGWTLDGGIDFRFPEQTRLAPQQYVVIARDPAQLVTQFPDLAPLGPWKGTLSNSDEHVTLRDARGNVADEVHYYDGGRWPEWADGGGSSLELIDVRSDNRLGENWGSSDTLANTEWQSYTLRAIATHPANLNVPDLFDELLVGLLDAGEILLDDVRLIEDPDSRRISRLTNGTFSQDSLGEPPAAWRWLGNHEQTVVVADPDDSRNHVLKIVATGPTEHMHNHGESTLAEGAQISVGAVYELSFRARWLHGSPQLNTRLYFTRAAATTIIQPADRAGTPGHANSVARANVGPALDGLRHTPLVPSPLEPVVVEVTARDPDGIQNVQLHYAINGGSWQTIPMVASDGFTYRGTIPGQPKDAVVQFFVNGNDGLGASRTLPAEGPTSRALYQVAAPLNVPQVHTVRLIMTSADSNKLHAATQVMSNGRIGATLVVNDQEVYYDVGVRLRASGYGRQGALAGFNIQFDPQQLFRGVHSTVSLDRGSVFSSGTGAGGVQGVAGASPHELLIYQIAHRATGIAGMYDDVVYVDAPRNTNTGMALLKMARYTDAFLDTQFDDGGEGTLFKFELIYHSTTANAQGYKLPPAAVIANDIQDYGDDREAYRHNFVLKNNTAADDYSQIIELGKAFSLTGEPLEKAAAEIMDIDEWMRTFALISLVGTADTYNMGLAHNLELYVRPEDGKVLAFPWDMDHGFYYAPRANLLGQGGSNLGKVIARPIYQRLFYKHVLDIVQQAYNTETVTPWAQHYTSITGHGDAQFFIDYVTQRAAYARERVAAAVPATPFQITSNQGDPMTVNGAQVTLEGQGWVDVHQIRVEGAEQPLPITWLDLRSWRIDVPLVPGANRLALIATNFRGEIVGQDTIEVTSTELATVAQRFLRVTEVMYHPAPPTVAELTVNPNWTADDFEYLELANTSPVIPLVLQGVRFTNGPAETLALNDPAQAIPPLGRRVVVANREAFVARYGQSDIILAEYAGNLRNSGERIRWEDGLGRTIVDFVYADATPWPLTPDGQGPSLELLQPTTPVDQLSEPTQWHASFARWGSPGRATATSADLDRDGRVTSADIDALCRDLQSLRTFDLDGDSHVDDGDVDFLVFNMLGTTYGDADLNGVFDSSDFVRVFQAGTYEDNAEDNAVWASGDWTCDGDFTSADLVRAFQAGGFVAAARPTRHK